MKKVLLGIMLLSVSAIACAPTVISKCHKDYFYEGDKLKSEYQECITQNPGQKSHMTMKHQELFD
jgi:hypothetical protein